VVLDRAGRVAFVDDEMAALFGFAATQLLGQDMFHFVDAHERTAARQALRRAERTGRVGPAAWWVRGGGGRRFKVALQPHPLAGPQGERLYVVAARVASKGNEVVERQALLAAIAEECEEAMISSGAGGLVTVWNRAAEEVFGWTEKEAVGADIAMLVPPDVRHEAEQLMERAWAGEVVSRVESVRVNKDGFRLEVSVSLAPLRDVWGRITGVSQVIRDITQQKATERALAYQAMHDSLTGLPNRMLLEDRMSHALERCRREGQGLAVMFFDLDHLKTVNDTAGHQVGDNLLRAVAARFRESLRSTDTVARMGGDEFVVLCEDISDGTQLDAIVSHIMGAFGEPVVLPDRQVWVSVSAGVVRGGGESSVSQLLSQADAAMYQAKERARGSVVHYDPSTHAHLENRAEVSRMLRQGLGSPSELLPYYQPVVDLHTGVVVGAEALVRWEDPLRGLIEAREFVPLAEELGLIAEISERVLVEAVSQLAGWRRRHPSFTIAVNVSPLQLRGVGLLSAAHRLIDSGADPEGVVLEVTESTLMDDAGTSVPILRELREAGFGIAIDDFGTGYSSLACLRRLPATSIKVDKAFTSQLPDPQDLSVVMAILAIADSYGLAVVAEGIETAEQAEILRSLGCPHGQGYYFARAMPAAQLTRALDLRSAGTVPA
jgi:diguanylate cyclase (GGDEF)-like protein/PAS domain S-box-containing protein